MVGVYIHWPYCARLCPYCDFNIYRARGDDPALVQAIADDISEHAQRFALGEAETIHFGGGTPSLLAPDQIAALIEAVRTSLGLAASAEITLEANPDDADAFAAQAQAGINRFSLGVQALDDASLKALGRTHDAAQARRAVETAAHTGRRVSIDLIYAREGQSAEAWRAELRAALALPIGHVSPYQLTIEEGTAFDRAVTRGTLHPPAAELAADLYELTQEECARAVFRGYEISNHARGDDERSRHNLLYWRSRTWIGVGPGAHGRFAHAGARHETLAARTPRDYIETVARTGVGFAAFAPLSARDAAREALLLGLRIDEGVARSAILDAPLDEAAAASFVAEGLLHDDGARLALTERGRLFADRIAMDLVV